MDTDALSLHQLLMKVKAIVKDALPESWWIVAEVSEMKVNYSGHCYLELVEKASENEAVKAKARATIWATVFRMLQPYFETTTNTRLEAGLKILVRVTVELHEVYGFSLNIIDIDPSYTLGDLARQRKEVIDRLKAEGVFNMNKELVMPALPQKIAVVSSATAAGYGDFIDQLKNNAFGYRFYVRLFSAVMQGDDAEQSIISALDKIFEYEDFFDLVVIIRGGGARSDLGCFDSYLLASNICQFPLPVMTGIGHEQDETITDMVAHTRLKTPTAVAEFLINIFREADEYINELTSAILEAVLEQINEEKAKMNRYSLILRPVIKEQISLQKSALKWIGVRISSLARESLSKNYGLIDRKKLQLITGLKSLLRDRKRFIDSLSEKCTYMDPFLILKRGYSVTYYKGKALKDPKDITEDEIIETKLTGGILKSKTLKHSSDDK